MNNCTGIVFDMDGTIVDTLDDITDTLNISVEGIRQAPMTKEEVRAVVGDGLEALMAKASGCSDPKVVDELVIKFRAYYRDHLLDRSKLYDGWTEVLDQLAEWGVPFSILSNKPDDFTKTIASALLPRWDVFIVEGQLPDFVPKPHPDRTIAICEMMDITPANSIFVGDSEIDIHTGHNAGMISVGVTWGFRSRQVLVDAKPHHIIDTPAGLLPIVDQMRNGRS